MSRSILLLILCACGFTSQEQTVQKTRNILKLADQYYQAGEYYTAAYLYEQYLHPSKQANQAAFTLYAKKRSTSRKGPLTDILYKQAESYRLAHYFGRADSAYKLCTGHIDALYWQAVCQRSLGNYAAAEDAIHQYLTTGGSGQFEKEATKELQTLEFIRKQLALADTALIRCKKIPAREGYERGAYAVNAAVNDQYLVSSTQTVQVAGKASNPHQSRLFYATIKDDSLSQMTPLPMVPGFNQGAASTSADGNRIYFTQWKKENASVSSNIYYIDKQSDVPVLLEDIHMAGHNTRQPFCTPDGKYLYFAADRPGGSGGFDIWCIDLANNSAPINAGPSINTPGDEQAPFYHSGSGTLVYSSNGKPGMGGYDLFAAKGSATKWEDANNLGYPVNSSRDDIYFHAPDKAPLLAEAIVGSDRGDGCCIETWRINKKIKSKRLNGLVLDCKNGNPLMNALVVLKDAGGNTREAHTGIDGKFVFDTFDIPVKDLSLAVSKEPYKDTLAAVDIKHTDERGVLVDELFMADLCLDKKFVLNPDNVVSIFFDFDKSNLSAEAAHKVDAVYNILMNNPTARIQISGYTDGRGSVEYNKKLSDKRARSCAEYLIKMGIPADRISFESFGSCCPVEMELINGRDNPDGRSRNRRAMINIVKD
jgi:OmpA-OmpF porin, OOP family